MAALGVVGMPQFRALIASRAFGLLPRMPKPSPAGWPRISTSLVYEDANAAIDFFVRAFGFALRIKVDGDDGSVKHSELTYGEDGLIMVSTPHRPWSKSPRALDGANTQSLMMYVDDVDAFVENAQKHGAKVISEPTDVDYGEGYWADRSAELVDLEGHRWWITQRLRG